MADIIDFESFKKPIKITETTDRENMIEIAYKILMMTKGDFHIIVEGEDCQSVFKIDTSSYNVVFTTDSEKFKELEYKNRFACLHDWL